MGVNFSHFTSEERDLIGIRRAEGKKLQEIANEIGKNKGSISRELKRNKSSKGLYLPQEANNQATTRWSVSHKKERIPNSFTRNYIKDKIINEQWTPEQISGRLKLEYPEHYVSHETIYQYIYTNESELGLCLPRKHYARIPKSLLKKAKGSKIPNRVSIKERPPEVEKREDFGHLEADCIVSSRKGKGALLTIVERLSRYMTIAKLDEKTSSSTNLALSSSLSEYPTDMLKSITYDNGTEFAGHTEISDAFNIQSYFCEPYHSWEKGSIENRNGIVRRYFPKGTDFSQITIEQIKAVQDKINNKPLKCLGFLTPKEVRDKIVNDYLEKQLVAFAA